MGKIAIAVLENDAINILGLRHIVSDEDSGCVPQTGGLSSPRVKVSEGILRPSKIPSCSNAFQPENISLSELTGAILSHDRYPERNSFYNLEGLK
jgi:hypothetical protein